ncbi:heme ABC transporter ATP-binding protein [Rhodococcus sp. X156]|uniref:heme ABC transporter ATP-binding protein n=1 Tax=Rhodococcus sp. X156 TaxID=2499145 RepID=UPI000FDA7E39|nr:heme ABC transporter ATP-binding protein [Rhodococcus sp. X156]
MRLPFGRAPEGAPATAPAGTPLLSCAGVVVRRGGRTVLDDFTVQVRAGEVLVLVGPNGAGKSTALGVLAGDVAPAAGAVRLHQRALSQFSDGERARRRAVLPQQHGVGFPFSAHEVVAMGRHPWAATSMPADDERIIAASMAAADVAHLDQRRFTELSGGERARVALARVLAQDTQVLLLDEPTAALDIGHQEAVMDLMRRRAEQGCAVVVVLHDLSAAAVHADRVVVLGDGRVVGCGSPEEVLRPDLLSELYGVSIDVIRHPRTQVPIVVPTRG